MNRLFFSIFTDGKLGYIILILLIIGTILWDIIFQLTQLDPEIEEKYHIASEDLSEIKAAIIHYYCKNGRFPATLEALASETMLQLPTDPWGNKYILTALAWRQKGSGVDILSMGGDGKRGGKGWKCDIINRVDLTEIHCEEKILLEK